MDYMQSRWQTTYQRECSLGLKSPFLLNQNKLINTNLWTIHVLSSPVTEIQFICSFPNYQQT
jgi:hypothetical protein